MRHKKWHPTIPAHPTRSSRPRQKQTIPPKLRLRPTPILPRTRKTLKQIRQNLRRQNTLHGKKPLSRSLKKRRRPRNQNSHRKTNKRHRHPNMPSSNLTLTTLTTPFPNRNKKRKKIIILDQTKPAALS